MCLFTNKENMKLRKIAVLIPAHNEEKVIGRTLSSLLKFVPSQDLYVVSDGSTDSTEEVARKYTSNVFVLNPNVGKATAMNRAIKKFKLAERYKYLMPMDADTVPTASFIKATLPIFEEDKEGKIACVVGKVVGYGNNWITNYRLWEYEIAQTIHKTAQAKENAVIVCPGCATIYRAKVFKTLEIPTGTLTEDMDFTFLIHRRKLGRIVFTEEAKVVTQDPRTLKDFLKQIRRWYTGFWQTVLKHEIPWGGQPIDFEVALLASEGIFSSLIVIMLIIFLPVVLLKNPVVLAVPFAIDLLVFMIPTLFLTAARNNAWKIFFYLPHFYFLRAVSSLIFLKSFLSVLLVKDLKVGWNKVARYTIK